MFIELTDHLRCPLEHPEGYLVLLPESVVDRQVKAGHLGCPACGWNTDFTDGVVDFGGAPPTAQSTSLTADAIEAFLGLSGPGGYVVLAGAATAPAADLADRLPGIHVVLVNPVDFPAPPPASRLRAARLPLKTGSMRGVVLGGDRSGDPYWVREAARVTLPGLRIVGEGAPPAADDLEVLAEGGGAWVGRKKALVR
jgi:hypothetical protein